VINEFSYQNYNENVLINSFYAEIILFIDALSIINVGYIFFNDRFILFNDVFIHKKDVLISIIVIWKSFIFVSKRHMVVIIVCFDVLNCNMVVLYCDIDVLNCGIVVRKDVFVVLYPIAQLHSFPSKGFVVQKL